MEVLHPRRLYRGTATERATLDTTGFSVGTWFLEEDTLKILYWSGSIWLELINLISPYETTTYHEQTGFVPGANTPPENHWLLLFQGDGMYVLDDLGNLYGPMVSGGANIGGGKGIFKQNSGGTLEFRTLEAGDNILITNTGQSLRFDVSGAVLGNNAGTVAGDAHVFINVTGGNQLNFNGVIGLDGISVSENIVDNEIEVALDYPSLNPLGDEIEDTVDLFPIYNVSEGEHQTANLVEILRPQLYFGYQTRTDGGTYDTDLEDPGIYYSLLHTATVWVEAVVVGEYNTGSKVIHPPNYPSKNLITANVFAYFPAGCTVSILLNGNPIGLDAYQHTTGLRNISLGGIIETSDNTDFITVAATHPTGSVTVETYHVDLTIQRITGA